MRFIYTKGFLIFVSCLAALSLLVIFEAKGWVGPLKLALLKAPQPVVSVFSSVARPVKGFFSTAYRLQRLVSENARLEQKAGELSRQLVLLEQYRIENEALKRELGFAKSSGLSLAPCRTLGRNPLRLSDTVTVSCGTEQGVAEGHALISQGYLIGKVIYAGKDTSTVLLVTSSRFSTDAKLSKSGAPGIAGGSFGTGLVFDRLSQNEPVEKGMLVVTAGLSEKVPKSILIGEVGDTISGPNDLFKKTVLVSPVDFSNLDFLFAVKVP